MNQDKAREDSLVYMSLDKWTNIQSEFKQDWPRGVSAYWAMETQKQWAEQGLEHDFKVFCPFGNPVYGMVAINNKKNFYEIIIQCPVDNTTQLEEALRRTNRINWKQRMVMPFPPPHIIKCIQNVKKDVNMQLRESDSPHEMFLLDRKKPIFQDANLPENTTFKLLTEEHIDLVDSNWVNRYNGSKWIIEKFIRAKSGYGIIEGKELACWVFINEVGALTHLFTLERHRKKGYAELLLKLVCNIQIKYNKDSFAYCMIGNVSATKLYYKIGFEKCHVVNWCFLKPVDRAMSSI